MGAGVKKTFVFDENTRIKRFTDKQLVIYIPTYCIIIILLLGTCVQTKKNLKSRFGAVIKKLNIQNVNSFLISQI